MPTGAFDIYQTDAGYVAVTNETRRTILSLLAEQERELPELVEATGKAKPTLSSVHMKDLLARGLVRSETHPTDSRRKVFRLVARKIGSSDVPVANLRDAVKEYVTRAPDAPRFPIHIAFDAIASAPARVTPDDVRAQAKRLGEHMSHAAPARDAESFVMAIARLLEQEGLARPVRLDMERHGLELTFGKHIAEGHDQERIAHMLAGLIEGAGQSRGFVSAAPELVIDGRPRRCAIQWG